MPEVNERDAKLIELLNEAYGKERQIETALETASGCHYTRGLREAPARPPEGDQVTRKLGGAPDKGAWRKRRHDFGTGSRGYGEGGADRAGGHAPGPGGLSGGAAGDPRLGRAGEDAAQRSCRIPGRGRGDRDVHGPRGAGHLRRRQGDSEARPRYPPRGGTHGAVPRRPPPGARVERGARHHSRLSDRRRRRPRHDPGREDAVPRGKLS